jgi:hypothetical protein
MFYAIPGENFSREDQENQHEGESVGLRLLWLSSLWCLAGISGRNSF